MTSRHEGCVSTMLTDKRLKYCTAGAPLQGSVRRNGGCKPTSTAFRVFSVLTMRGRALSCTEGDGTRRAMRAACLHGAASRVVPMVLPLGRLTTLWALC